MTTIFSHNNAICTVVGFILCENALQTNVKASDVLSSLLHLSENNHMSSCAKSDCAISNSTCAAAASNLRPSANCLFLSGNWTPTARRSFGLQNSCNDNLLEIQKTTDVSCQLLWKAIISITQLLMSKLEPSGGGGGGEGHFEGVAPAAMFVESVNNADKQSS